MDSKILLGKILQRFSDMKIAQVEGYNSFIYIRETNNAVIISRENGSNASISYSKITKGIELYQNLLSLYHEGPSSLRKFGITHVTSPVWSLLHLLAKEEYK